VNVFIVSASSGQKNTILGKSWHLGAPVPTPFYRRGPNLVCYSDQQCTFTCQKSSRSVYSVALRQRKKTNLCRFLDIGMSTVGGNLSKLNTGAQLQTFPYLTASIPFLYSNAFMAKSGEQTLTFKSVTDRQKTQRFPRPRLRVKSEPHQTWHGDRGPRARSCTFKTGLTHSFAAMGHWKFGGNQIFKFWRRSREQRSGIWYFRILKLRPSPVV